MYDMSNLDKLATLQKNTPEALAAFQALDKAALAAGATEQELSETVFVATALRAGAALTHGTHLL